MSVFCTSQLEFNSNAKRLKTKINLYYISRFCLYHSTLASATQTNQLMEYREVSHSDSLIKLANMKSGQNVEFLKVKLGGTYLVVRKVTTGLYRVHDVM